MCSEELAGRPRALLAPMPLAPAPLVDSKNQHQETSFPAEKFRTFVLKFRWAVGALLRPLGGLLGASWRPLGGLLGVSWGPLGGPLGGGGVGGVLEGSWRPLGALWGTPQKV